MVYEPLGFRALIEDVCCLEADGTFAFTDEEES